MRTIVKLILAPATIVAVILMCLGALGFLYCNWMDGKIYTRK